MEKEIKTEIVLKGDANYDLAGFIRSILGKPQTINKIHLGSFDINLSNLTDIYQLLDQRIMQQNDAKFIQFKTRIIFSDNSSILL
ncbi:MAG: hypothetical protein AABY22_11545, partial [Nanoarchaeota archaeon]